MNDKEILFCQELYKSLDEKSERNLIPKDKYENILSRIKELEDDKTIKKTQNDYYLIKRYDVLTIGDVSKLIKKKVSPDEPVRYYVTIEETYDIIRKCYIALNHAGRDKMLKELKRKYANISENHVNLYKSTCEECQLKTKNPNKGVVVKPILSKEFNSRGQVDLMDMQSMHDGDYRFIFNYQDHLTKYCVIEPLTTKRAAEVAHTLLNSVFLVFGAPHILQSDNGREFTAQVIEELKDMWPELVIVHGRPRHPQSQGSIERSNADIHDMLVSWMRDNNTTHWTRGLKFVQFAKNRRHHDGIKRSPYAAMFGCEPKVGLSSSSLPNEILNVLAKEEDLEVHLCGPGTSDAVGGSSNVGDTNSDNDSAQSSRNAPENSDAVNFDGNIDVGDTNSDNNNAQISSNAPENSDTVNVGGNVDVTNSDNDNAQCSSNAAQGMNDVTPVNVNVSSWFDDENEPNRTCSKCDASLLSEGESLCHLCKRSDNIRRERHCSGEAMAKQANRMVVRSNRVLRPIGVGDNVLVPIPSVDRGKGDPRNIMCYVLLDENDKFTLGTRHGILAQTFSRSQFTPTTYTGISEDCVNKENTITVREAARAQSIGDGQGFLRCSCKSGCKTKLCKCRKNQILCNSRCHGSLTCHNK